MKKITGYWHYNYTPSATEECKALLQHLGIKHCIINTQRGSHSGNIFLNDDDKKKFENEILDNTFIGCFRAFYFGTCYGWGGITNYVVSYINKNKYE